MDVLVFALMAAAGIGLLALVIKVFATPLRWALKLLLNAVIGFAALFIVNFLGGFVGLSLGINLLNAIVVGILGVPGIALLLLLKYLI